MTARQRHVRPMLHVLAALAAFAAVAGLGCSAHRKPARQQQAQSTVAPAAAAPTPAAAACTGTGRVTGNVVDEAGAAFPLAAVFLASEDGSTVLSAESDVAGAFRFPGVPCGEYELYAFSEGFTSTKFTNVAVGPDTANDLTVGMARARSLDRVVILGPRLMEIVDTKRTERSMPLRDQRGAPPLQTRRIQDLVARFPGVIRSGSSDDSIGGGRAGEIGYRLDGASFDLVTGGSAARHGERYARIDENPWRATADEPVGTFAVDVDTASYSNVRRYLDVGQLPPAEAVRIEELVNYFSYDDPEPEGPDPVAVRTEVADCPWAPGHRLLRVGLRARGLDGDMPARNLVFLVDVSGSMSSPDKLPLLAATLKLLADSLAAQDRVAIVVYAGAAGLVLPTTSGDQQEVVREALDRLTAGGSTNGGEGIRLAYRLARDAFIPGGVNRVILATDGDFNVGVASPDELVALIETERKSGVFLSVLGFGAGNYNDHGMEQLADEGNGNYAYVDSLREGHRALVVRAGGTLVTIAKDVKVQVDFDPAAVRAWRLVGYENRVMPNEDFREDAKDAGEMGAGHVVTALFELEPASKAGPLGVVRVRFKEPDGDVAAESSFPLVDGGARLAEASADLRFAAAVAGFGMLLRGSEHAGTGTWDAVLELARGAAGVDAAGERGELLLLAERAARLDAGDSPDAAIGATVR